MNGIKCGHCRGRHESVRQVRECSREGRLTSRSVAKEASVNEAKARLAEKTEFAAREREQEEAGFASDPDFRAFVARSGEVVENRAVADGFYTVVMSDEPNDYVTIRIQTQEKNAKFAPGEQVASYLMGPDNESDYAGFAFVKPDGNFNVWKRFKASHNLINALGVLTQDPEEAGQAYALTSGRCRRCRRTLTVPASIHRGFGPDCAGMVGL